MCVCCVLVRYTSWKNINKIKQSLYKLKKSGFFQNHLVIEVTPISTNINIRYLVQVSKLVKSIQFPKLGNFILSFDTLSHKNREHIKPSIQLIELEYPNNVFVIKSTYLQTSTLITYITTPQHLKKKILYQKIDLKRKQPSQEKILKRRKFLYINCKLFLKHRTFLHHFHIYLHGKGTKFDEETLQAHAFEQKSTFSLRLKKGGKINLVYLPKDPITY